MRAISHGETDRPCLTERLRLRDSVDCRIRAYGAKTTTRYGIVRVMPRGKGESLSTMGLFAGIGGIERGLELAGHRNHLLCEIDPGARKVLEHHFEAKIERDIRRIGGAFPKVDLIAAGFPCQDLSQAGATAGITGKQSRLIGEVFKRLRHKKNGARWLLLENVPFMLQLERGKAMRYLVDEL